MPETLVSGKTYEMTYLTNVPAKTGELPLLKIRNIKDKDENLLDVFEEWAYLNLPRANCNLSVPKFIEI